MCGSLNINKLNARKEFMKMAKVITIDLSLNPIYILVAFAGLLIVNTIIAISFSLIACNSVSKKPILEVLVENR